MKEITRRLNKAEKALRIEEPHLINFEGIKIMSDEFEKLYKQICAESKGIPIRQQKTTKSN